MRQERPVRQERPSWYVPVDPPTERQARQEEAVRREDPAALEEYLLEVDENPFVEDAFDPRAERLRQNYAARRQQSGRGKKGGARLKKPDRRR